jgi:hypothetical protein
MGGGAHGGGFSGHAAPAFHGGPGAPVRLPLLNGGLPAPWPGGNGIYGARSGSAGTHGGYGQHRGGGYYRGPMWGGWLGAGYPGYFGDDGDLGTLGTGYDDSSAGAAGSPTPDYGAAAGLDYGPAGPPTGYVAGPPPYGAGAAAGYPAGYAAGPGPSYTPGSTPGVAAAPAAGNGPVAPGYRPAYQAAAGAPPAASTVAAAPRDEDAVTLVFKDGRPAEHIHNYAMTRTTLYVQDPHHREIPMEELDLAATEKANREAGVSFEAPQGAQ